MSLETPTTESAGAHAHTDLSGFKKTVLFALAELDEGSGSEIRDVLDDYYGEEGRHWTGAYIALDQLGEGGLIHKRADPADGRSNLYTLTDAGETVVREEFGWLQERLFPSQRGGRQ